MDKRKKRVVVIDIVRQVHADLLILDIMMPGLSGLELYDRVREDAGVRDMPVLFDINDLRQRAPGLCPA